MAQARDEAGNIWETDAQGNAVRLIQAAPQQAGRQGGVYTDQAALDRRNIEAQRGQIAVDTAAAQAPYAGPAAATQGVPAGYMWNRDGTGVIPIPGYVDPSEVDPEAQRAKSIRQRLSTGNILQAVKDARAAAQKGGTGYSSLLAGLPQSDARELESILAPIKATLAFDRLQQMRDESKTGGALGAVSEREIDLLQGAVASLDTGVSLGRFLNNLDTIEKHFIGSQLALAGVEPESEQGQQVFSEYGVDVPLEGQALNQRQQSVMNAVLAANPNADAAQLASIFEAAGIPPIENLEQLVQDRQAGGVIDPSRSMFGEGGYEQSLLGQGLSGINTGIANTLGLPVDAATFGLNLIPQGINAIANTNIPTIENPVGGGEFFRDLMAPTIFEPTEDPTAQFVRRTGESVGGALLPVGMAANTGRQLGAGLLSAAGGGIGGATAQQVAPGNVEAEIAAELLGGGLAGGALAGLGRRQAQREIESAVPSSQELRDQADVLYTQAENRGITASPDQTKELAERMRRTLREEGQLGPSGRITDADSSTSKALNLVEQYEGLPMTPTEMNTIRKVIADGRKSMDASDKRIASILLDDFDDFVAPLAPEFDEARSVASRYLNAGDLEQARELAGVQAGQFTGSGFENALRTQYRGLDRSNVRGRSPYPPEVVEAIRDVSRGTPASNAARAVGRFAPTGVVSAGLGGGIPAIVGTAMGGPIVGGALGAGAMGAGAAGRNIATRIGERNADIAELLARSGGQVDQAPLLTDETNRLIMALLANPAATGLENE